MRFNLTALGLALTLTQPLAAQGRYGLSLGGVWSTPIVTDHIFNDIDLQPALAPAVTLNASWPVSPKARLGAEASFATGHLNSKESGQSVDIGTLRTLTVTGGVEAPLVGKLWGRLGGGFIKYLPAEDEGVFQQGGPLRWVLGLGVDYRWQWKPRWQWVAGVRYDFHRFTTDELVAQGFGGTQDVHRVMISIGIARTP
jgi:hypothetical protein